MTPGNSFPKVSIIITTYNGGKYIAETIESVLNQTYKNWELVIVDDGSEDNTCDIINATNDERIQLNRAGRIGVNGKIKNMGLSKSTGELIAFLDHDDLWAPAKIEKQVTALQQYPEAGFSLTGGFNFRKALEPIDYFYRQTEGMKVDNVFLSFFRSELPGFTQALMVRKECIEIAGLFDESKPFSDTNFILELARRFKAVILYEPLVFRRLHDANHNQSNWEKSYDEGIEIIESYKEIVPVQVVKDALFRVYINLGEESLVNKKRLKSADSFFKAWKIKPFSFIPLKKATKVVIHYLKR